MKKHNHKPQKELFNSLFHMQGKEYIDHFSSIKIRYKNLVIFVISAVLIALSYISDIKTTDIQISKIYLVDLITILALVGTNLIRHLDLNISHEQIRQLYKVIIELEEKNENLSKPYFEIKKILYRKNSDPGIFDLLYYAAFNIILILFGIMLMLAHIRSHHPELNIIFCFLILILFLLWEIICFVLFFRGKLKM